MKTATMPNRSKTIVIPLEKIKVRRRFARGQQAFGNKRAYRRLKGNWSAYADE